MAEIVELTDANFGTEVEASEVPVMVDFTATWCAPCQALHPIIESLAPDFDGKIKIGKLDITDNRDTPTKFQVMSVPTLIFFRNGTAVDKWTGLLSANELRKKLEALLEG